MWHRLISSHRTNTEKLCHLTPAGHTMVTMSWTLMPATRPMIPKRSLRNRCTDFSIHNMISGDMTRIHGLAVDASADTCPTSWSVVVQAVPDALEHKISPRPVRNHKVLSFGSRISPRLARIHKSICIRLRISPRHPKSALKAKISAGAVSVILNH